MQTGSFMNLLMSKAQDAQPVIGMGATLLGWTDRHPMTVIAVRKNGKEIDVQSDNAVRIDNNGMSGAQDYEFSPNPNGGVSTFSLRKNGAWVRVGQAAKNGQRLAVGYRSKYYDYSF